MEKRRIVLLCKIEQVQVIEIAILYVIKDCTSQFIFTYFILIELHLAKNAH